MHLKWYIWHQQNSFNKRKRYSEVLSHQTFCFLILNGIDSTFLSHCNKKNFGVKWPTISRESFISIVSKHCRYLDYTVILLTWTKFDSYKLGAQKGKHDEQIFTQLERLSLCTIFFFKLLWINYPTFCYVRWSPGDQNYFSNYFLRFKIRFFLKSCLKIKEVCIGHKSGWNYR